MKLFNGVNHVKWIKSIMSMNTTHFYSCTFIFVRGFVQLFLSLAWREFHKWLECFFFVNLTHFAIMLNFYTSWKRQKTFGSLTCSRGIKSEYWCETDLKKHFPRYTNTKGTGKSSLNYLDSWCAILSYHV